MIAFENAELKSMIEKNSTLCDLFEFALSTMTLHGESNRSAAIHSVIVNASLYCREKAKEITNRIATSQAYLPKETYSAREYFDKLADMLNDEATAMRLM